MHGWQMDIQTTDAMIYVYERETADKAFEMTRRISDASKDWASLNNWNHKQRFYGEFLITIT